MTIFRNSLKLSLGLLLLHTFSCTDAVLNKEFKRREAFDSYGPPPRPAPQYGPPPQPQRLPHREYGVPQHIPFREYHAPSIKYGPPKFIGGGGGGGFSNNNFGGGLHEQIKTHFGVPKPFYGPPHIQHKPAGSYGPPPLPQPQAQYGPPPPRPQPQYGPPPKPQYGPPPPPAFRPQSLPAPFPAPLFKPPHHPATSYGPPPSGPLNAPPPKPVYGPPAPNYGPPPLPNVPGPQPANFHRVPETTVILTGGNIGGNIQPSGGPVKQVQIQIDASGHTHSISGSQAPFHTACDGWKPIPAPVGAYVENNHIDTQSGYSHVSQGSAGAAFGTQYNAGSVSGGGNVNIEIGPSGGAPNAGGSIVDGLTDEQLVAIALQSGGFEHQNAGGLAPPTGPSGHGGSLNSIETEALQLSLGSIDDSYTRPPADSFAPGSVHAQKYNTINGGPGLVPPSGNYLPPVPSGPAASFVQQHHHHHSAGAQANLGIQYGKQSGNTVPLPPIPVPAPNKPVAFRPPVPQGLIESIGATVQHLDQFGVKPPSQPGTYLPPAANEIATTGPGNASPEYGPPPLPIIQQQLPPVAPAPGFAQVNQFAQNQQFNHHHHHHQQHFQQNQQQQFQQQHFQPPPPQQQPPQFQPPNFNYLPPLQGPPQGNNLNQYGPPPPLPGPPQPQFAPPPPPPAQQYLPPTGGSLSFHQSNSGFEHSYSASSLNHQFAQAQGQLQEPRFHQVHDCGQGPNLVGAGYQAQQQTFANSASNGGLNSITQSIPIAEQHTQFIAGPTDSYGPPASGNEIDHEGYASQKNSVTALPDGSTPQDLPGLDGLNVISAQKSQSIQLTEEEAKHAIEQTQRSTQQAAFQVEGAGASGSPLNEEQSADHEEILSQGLLQTILSAIEQPNEQNKQKPAESHLENHVVNHHYSAQNRADINPEDEVIPNDGEEEPAVADSSIVETKVSPNEDEGEVATVKEIKPIVAAEVDETQADEDAKH